MSKTSPCKKDHQALLIASAILLVGLPVLCTLAFAVAPKPAVVAVEASEPAPEPAPEPVVEPVVEPAAKPSPGAVSRVIHNILKSFVVFIFAGSSIIGVWLVFHQQRLARKEEQLRLATTRRELAVARRELVSRLNRNPCDSEAMNDATRAYNNGDGNAEWLYSLSLRCVRLSGGEPVTKRFALNAGREFQRSVGRRDEQMLRNDIDAQGDLLASHTETATLAHRPHKTNCTNCGAPLKSETCGYCGTKN